MTPRASARITLIAALALTGAGALAQDGPKPKGPPATGVDADVTRYCVNLAPTAAEARVAYQTRKLNELEAKIRQQLDALDAKEARAREWVGRREALMKSASEDIVAIYGKMSADAAAAQITNMDDAVAAAVLTKLNPRAASAILGEMEAERAAKLASLMAGAGSEDGKS
jgi:flagellar motility protein MotE (MotC chaperone)